MQASDNYPGVTFQEASVGVPSAPAGVTTTAAFPASSESGQTTEATSSSTNSKPVPASPPLDASSNATSSTGSSQLSLNGGDGNQKNQKLLSLDDVEKKASRTGTYFGALIMTAAVVPVVAALISAIAFVVQWPTGVTLPDWLRQFIGTPLLLGTVSTLVVWLLLGLIVRRFTAADRMNMSSYGELLNHLSTLNAQISVLYPKSATIPPTMAGREVLDCCDAIHNKLVKKGLAWVTATGYINLWKEMHNAEEALIDLMPREAVIADAIYDESSIQDSNIETSEELLKKLRVAVMVLNPSAKAYLQSPPPDGVLTGTTPEQARSVLREVRHALNGFRDGRWEAIVRVRNQFVCATILTGLTLYALLQFAILAGASRSAIMSATAFYLVGALVGLFSRLYSESQTSKSIDDYRLALSRLVAIPLYSGLAAVAGVVITQKVTTSLGSIFDPTNMLSGLIVAAGFGLTPSLLINTLQKQTETYKSDLNSTAATQGQGAKTPAIQGQGTRTP